MPDPDDEKRESTGFEYPDEAGYPDGTGTLDEGTRADAAATGAGGDADKADLAEADEATAGAAEIEDFAESDTEDE